MTPDTHRIVYTRHDDGGVTVVRPFEECLKWMGSGGRWDDRPRGFLDELVRRKTCPKLQGGKPATEAAAWKLVKAMQFGGLNTPERWDVIRSHDCERQGHTIEVHNISDIPTDRWFRDAWVRGHNSGYIEIDMAKARSIQWRKLLDAVSRENKRREFDLFGPAPIKLNKFEYQKAIKHARDDEELRRVWIAGLSRP